MPVPRPAKDENKNKFMGRCISFLHKENSTKPDKDKWTNEQMTAICFSQWEKKGKQASIDEDERETDEEFVKRFLAKYPQYTKYFVQESLEE